jgi:hypothetical protein
LNAKNAQAVLKCRSVQISLGLLGRKLQCVKGPSTVLVQVHGATQQFSGARLFDGVDLNAKNAEFGSARLFDGGGCMRS